MKLRNPHKIGRLAASAALFLAALPALAAGPYQFFAISPCRLVDTRNAAGPNAGPVIQRMTERDFQVQGKCGVPVGAKAAALNLTVLSATGTGWVAAWPSGTTQPTVSNVNFLNGENGLSNGAIVPLSSSTNDLATFTFLGAANGTINLVIDVNGYFM
jgi:hypothetical protein